MRLKTKFSDNSYPSYMKALHGI